jgi:hypothetical protein
MNRQLAVILCFAVLGFSSLPSQSWAQAKTAKACTEEWRADKAGFQAKGIPVFEKARSAPARYVHGSAARQVDGIFIVQLNCPHTSMPLPLKT